MRNVLKIFQMMSFLSRENKVNRDPQAHLESQVSRGPVGPEVQMVEEALPEHLGCLDQRGQREALDQMVPQES